MNEYVETQDLEVHFFALRDQIVGKLAKDFEGRTDIGGIVTRVVSNEWDGGSEALLIDNKGEWSGKMDMMGWDVGENPPLNELLEDYARIKDPQFQAIENQESKAGEAYTLSASPEVESIMNIRIHRMRMGEKEMPLSPDEQALLDEYHRGREVIEQEWQAKRQAYITQNRQRLLQGFISSMEETLQSWA